MVTSVLAVTASSWGVLMGISPLLQIRRMLHERSSREVSLGYYAILIAGFLLWISYGIAAQNLVLIVPNTVALLVGLTTDRGRPQAPPVLNTPARPPGPSWSAGNCGRSVHRRGVLPYRVRRNAWRHVQPELQPQAMHCPRHRRDPIGAGPL